ncbi:hypothetical protein AB1N83_002807 [Pleurotus pulmonarius]
MRFFCSSAREAVANRVRSFGLPRENRSLKGRYDSYAPNATKLGRLCVTEVKMKYGMLRRSRRHGGYLPWLFPFGGTGVRFVAPICRGSGWNVDRGSDEYPLSCLKDLGATAWAGVEHVLDS